MSSIQYQTRGGIQVQRQASLADYHQAVPELMARLDRQRGLLLSSSFEFPGRYTRWDIGFCNPPLALTLRARGFRLDALNPRGQALLPAIHAALALNPALTELSADAQALCGQIAQTDQLFAEELRSRQPSGFSLVRSLIELFGSQEDRFLGLYGAFGYDLVFQFEPMTLQRPRPDEQRDLLLYLPDEILVVDHMQQQATRYRYEFDCGAASTRALERSGAYAPYAPGNGAGCAPGTCDHAPGEYAAMVERARAAFARGDLFETVLSQLFSEPCSAAPSSVFQRLQQSNPAPYGALINLGEGEFLVAASPEMFVRVEGRRIETCPISGTIARGGDAMADAENIRRLLNSAKDEAELTMCTDVDRNDKSRVCVPGSVRVIGRRQIEMYSRLIHTVDHVEGRLQQGFDALDGFLSHAWAVTVTGAPKRWAIRFIEQQERSTRRWYGGAIGSLNFDGNMNTGLTLRTIRMQNGIAEVRAGATLLYDSDAEAEEAETRLKAAALLAVLRAPVATPRAAAPSPGAGPGAGMRVLLVDHEDSFVHTLASYLRASGAEVSTLRAALARAQLRQGMRPDLVVLSPGPGRPADFDLHATLDLLLAQRLPVFGVCLGLQGIVEYFGGQLAQLEAPMHGKASPVHLNSARLLNGAPARFSVGRYHSMHAPLASLPQVLHCVAVSDDQIVMALEHRTLPIAAVQFHPESIMTAADSVGFPILNAVLRYAGVHRAAVAAAGETGWSDALGRAEREG